MGLIPGSGRSLGGGHGNPLQYSCLENPMDRGAWWATVHRVAKSRTGLKQQPACMQPSVSSVQFSSVQFSHSVMSNFLRAPWNVALQAPMSIGFYRQEYWSGFPCPPPRDLPDPGIKPTSVTSPALAGMFLTIGATWEAQMNQ